MDHHAEHVVQDLVYFEVEYELHAVAPGSHLAVVAGEVLMVWEEDQVPLGDFECADLVAFDEAFVAGCGKAFANKLDAGRRRVVAVFELGRGLFDHEMVHVFVHLILELGREVEELERFVAGGRGLVRYLGWSMRVGCVVAIEGSVGGSAKGDRGVGCRRCDGDRGVGGRGNGGFSRSW